MEYAVYFDDNNNIIGSKKLNNDIKRLVFFKNEIIINESEIPDQVKNTRLENGDIDFRNSIIDPESNLIKFSLERKNNNDMADLRSERDIELTKYDKYQLPYLQSTLTEEQINEYNTWRKAWLDVTETKIKPTRPEWFE